MTEIPTADNFETPYDDDDGVEFVTCTVCDKTIKGQALYKIHVTTTNHLKKEDDLVAQGLMTREQRAPIFDDILEYLNYLELGEPIIGLFVVQQTTYSNAERSTWPNYMCHMCKQNLNLPEMVHHLIGRKHRVKYMHSYWPDMVSEDMDSSGGAWTIRHKAEIIESQEGSGCPKPMKNLKKMWKSQHKGQTFPKSFQGNPKFDSAPKQHVNHFDDGKNVPDYSFDEDMAHGFNEDGEKYQRKEETSCNVQQGDWANEGQTNRGPRFSDPEFQRLYDQLMNDSPPPAVREPVFPRHNLSEEIPRGNTSYKDNTSDAAYSDWDRQEEPFSDNTKHKQDFRSSDFEAPKRYGSAETEERWGQNKPALKSNFTSNPTNAKQHDRILVKDYYHRISESSPNERFENPGPSRRVTPALSSSVNMKTLPEPFMRFLEGSKDRTGGRKRTSRFSDASPEEMANNRKVFRDDYSSDFNDPSNGSMLTGHQREFPSMGSGSFRGGKNSFQADFTPEFSSNLDGPLNRERLPNQTEFRPQYSSMSDGPSRSGSGRDQSLFRSQYSSMSDGPSRIGSGRDQSQFRSPYSSVSEGPSRRGIGQSLGESKLEYSSILDGPSRRERGPIHAEYRPQSSSGLADPPRSERGSFMAESHASLYPKFGKDSQDFSPGNRQKESSDAIAVLDMLDDVEIETQEDARFLKNKLLNILDEYKAKKMERSNQNNSGMNEEYNNPGSRRSQERSFESRLRNDGDMRRPNKTDFRDGQSRSGWRDDYGSSRGGPQGRPPMPRDETRPNRRAYEDVFGPEKMYPDEQQEGPKRLPQHMEPQNFRHNSNQQFDRNGGPPRDLDPKGPRSMQYSSNIDKLNSTLMALIRHK